jgi:hypothetical protein
MTVTYPAEEWSLKDRIRLLPSLGAVMHPSKLFRTANPTPCSRVPPLVFSASRTKSFFSQIDPDPGCLVSWRTTMAICILLNSMSIDDSGLVEVIDVLQIAGETRRHCPDVQCAQR